MRWTARIAADPASCVYAHSKMQGWLVTSAQTTIPVTWCLFIASAGLGLKRRRPIFWRNTEVVDSDGYPSLKDLSDLDGMKWTKESCAVYPMTSPVPSKGHLRLWTVPEDLVEEVLRRSR